LQEFQVFNIYVKKEHRPDHDSFSVIPNDSKKYGYFVVMEWQMKMICMKAANNDVKLAEHYYENVEYDKVYEYFTLITASKING